MQNSILAAALVVSWIAGSGCAGEPFSKARLDTDAAVDASTSYDAPPTPIRNEHSLTVAFTPPTDVTLAFAAHGANRLALFDASTGSLRFEQPFEGVVADLDWDRRAGRLLVVEQSPQGDGSRIHAFEIGAGGFTPIASSEALSAETRVFPLSPNVLALSEDMGASWSLFDAMLNREAPSKAIIKPAGLFIAEVEARSHAIALNPYADIDGAAVDELFDISFNGTWAVANVAFEAPGRPASRLARTPDRDLAYVVRKHTGSSNLQVGEFFALDPAPPKSFLEFPLDGGGGELEAALVDASGELLVALLSRASEPGALALVSLRSKNPAKVFELGALVEHSPWPSRALALSRRGELWVATVAGACGYRVSLANDTPTLEPIGIKPEFLAPIGVVN